MANDIQIYLQSVVKLCRGWLVNFNVFKAKLFSVNHRRVASLLSISMVNADRQESVSLHFLGLTFSGDMK